MKAIKVFFALFIFSLLTTQSVMDLFSILFCGLWVWGYWKENRGQLIKQRAKLLPSFGLEKVWTAWILICIIGFASNWMSASYAIERIIEFKWILILYAMIGAFIMIRPSEKQWKWIMGWLLVIGLINLLIFFWETPSLLSLRYGAKEGGLVRAGGLFGNPMTFSHSFVLLVLFSIGLLFWGYGKYAKFQLAFMALSCAVGVIGLFFTYTRGVWLGFIAALIAMMFLTRPKRALIFSVVFGLGSWFFYQQLPDNSDFHSRVSHTLSEAEGQSERKVIWKTHLEIFKDFPIFGAGYGQNSQLVPQYYAKNGVPPETLVSHAHNEYLHLAAGTGILGLLCYLYIWYFFFRNLIWLWQRSDLIAWDRGAVAGLLMGQIAFCVGSLTEANFEHAKVRFMVMLMWAYGIYLSEKYGVIVFTGYRKESLKTSIQKQSSITA